MTRGRFSSFGGYIKWVMVPTTRKSVQSMIKQKMLQVTIVGVTEHEADFFILDAFVSDQKSKGGFFHMSSYYALRLAGFCVG
jgi:hypothetical protein